VGNYLVCGESGSGKTELLKFLCRNCPLDELTVFVSFKHNKIFLQEHTVDGYLDKFLDIATEQSQSASQAQARLQREKARFVSVRRVGRGVRQAASDQLFEDGARGRLSILGGFAD
jgi:energy-coupling factor transporter ATP-binding protein EcfA2